MERGAKTTPWATWHVTVVWCSAGVDFSELESGKYQFQLCGEWKGCSAMIGTHM